MGWVGSPLVDKYSTVPPVILTANKDAADWTLQQNTGLPSFPFYRLRAIAYDGTKFIAAGDTWHVTQEGELDYNIPIIGTSPDGKRWTKQNINAELVNFFYCVATKHHCQAGFPSF